jgi:F-type H+-transporting ATPase subunit delta
MDQGLIPRRYAKALYKFAMEHKQEQAVYGLMKNLASAFDSEHSLQAAIYNPYIPAADKVSLLTVAAGAVSTDSCFTDFMKLLVENQRIAFARGIALAYVDIYRKANGIYKVEVVTAADLGTPEIDKLRSLIAKHLNNATIEYSQRVDPELIGGFVINIDNEQLDASISNELKQLRLKLLSN